MFFSFYEPFRPRLTSKFAKRANMIQQIFLLFNADFEFVEKLQKTQAKKLSTNK
jgi:hypothetical protein